MMMGMASKSLAPAFQKMADAMPHTVFTNYINAGLGYQTTMRVVDAFQKLGLPMPEGGNEFRGADQGAVIFLNKYGMTIRLERTGTRYGVHEASPWIAAPIAALHLGKARLEICAGCYLESDISYSIDLCRRLRYQGIDFWDNGVRNIGRTPVKTDHFPDGIRVVIDRTAVAKLTQGVEWAREWLQANGVDTKSFNDDEREAQEALNAFYGPLSEAFKKAWPDLSAQPDSKKMKDFWALCEEFMRGEKLIAGWNEGIDLKPADVSSIAFDVAERGREYDRRLKIYSRSAASSPGGAIPQSHPSPA